MDLDMIYRFCFVGLTGLIEPRVGFLLMLGYGLINAYRYVVAG